MRIPARHLAFLLLLAAGCGGGGGPARGPVDFGIDGAALVASLDIVERTFGPSDCEVTGGEVDGPGARRLLLFSLTVINHGEGDLVLGDPLAPEPPLASQDFAPDPCRDLRLLSAIARAELRDSCDAVVATRDMGLLLKDSARYGETPSHGYDEDYQGLTSGWGSEADLWLDITGVPAGAFTLRVSVNASGKIVEEDDEQANDVTVLVDVDDAPVTAPTPDSVDVTVDRAALALSVEFRDLFFEAADCEVIEGGVGGEGLRRLLRFDAVVVNYGADHLVIGDPLAPEPPFTPADFGTACEGGLVLTGVLTYELRVPCGGGVVAVRDDGLALKDSAARLAGPSQGFSPANQGISSGWASAHPGRWLDVTGVPGGDYDLVVTVNGIDQADDAQPDAVTIPVRVPSPSTPLLTPDTVDVTVDRDAIVDSVDVVDRTFSPTHCAVVEGAVGAPGLRRLLRFDTIVVNLGDENVVLGDPAAPEPPFLPADFIFSPCHGHYHFEGWANYELRDSTGAVVAFGHKQAFCLLDSLRYVALPSERYDCDFQGISAGWGDLYSRELDGQWVDITGVPEGDYDLVVTVNADGKVLEAHDEHPNTATVPVHVPDPAQPPP